jgi:hypothetical protein
MATRFTASATGRGRPRCKAWYCRAELKIIAAILEQPVIEKIFDPRRPRGDASDAGSILTAMVAVVPPLTITTRSQGRDAWRPA